MEDQILDFLDGRLQSTDEEELLHRLAVSPEKRGLLREHMKLRETITHASRTEQLAVPSNVTASLYRKLAYNGYAGAGLGSTVSVTRPMATAAPALMARNAAPIIHTGYRLSSVLTFAVLSFMLGVGFTSIIERNTTTLKTETLAAVAKPAVKTLNNPQGNFSSTRKTYTTWQAVPAAQRKSDQELAALESQDVNTVYMRAPIVFETAETPYDSRFLEEHPVMPRAVVALNDLKFENSASAMNVGSASSTYIEPQIAEVAAVETPGTSELISPVEPHMLSLRTDSDPETAEPVDFTFGDYAKDPSLTYASVRSGAGNLPGNRNGGKSSGSLNEFRLSYQVNDAFVVKASFGQFSPWENIAQGQMTDHSGITVIDVNPTLRSRFVVGAEAGLVMDPFSIPLELSAGALFDAEGLVYPRTSLLTRIVFGRDFSMLMGVEAILYSFDVESSVQSQMSSYRGKNPAVRDNLPSRSLSGFIGPTIEAAWHF